MNPALDQAYLERERYRTSPSSYAAEVLGEWSDAAGALFPPDLLEDATADLELPALAELLEPARGIVGVDWGVTYDRSAAVAVYRLPTQALNPDAELLPRFVAIPHVWPQGERLSSVVDDIAAWQAPFAFYSLEVNGVGSMPVQEVFARLRGTGTLARKWNPVATSAPRKTAGYGTILNLLERGQLILPRHPDLLRQLAGLRFEQGERGFMAIQAQDAATHDDIADALYLATLPYTPRDGGTACGLALLADPRRAVPDALPGGYDTGDEVQTGSGLYVARRPALQSVAGTELTFPPEVPTPRRSWSPAPEMQPTQSLYPLKEGA